MQVQNYKHLIVGAVFAGTLAVAVWPSAAYGQASKNPIFVTYEQVQQVLAEAMSGFSARIDQLTDRMAGAESINNDQDAAIAALQQQSAQQQQLIASQSAQLDQLQQTVSSHTSRLDTLEAVSNNGTPVGSAVYLYGILSAGTESNAVDLTAFNVATFRAEAFTGFGTFHLFHKDPQGTWTLVRVMSVGTNDPVNSETILLADGEYKVVLASGSNFRGSFTSIQY